VTPLAIWIEKPVDGVRRRRPAPASATRLNGAGRRDDGRAIVGRVDEALYRNDREPVTRRRAALHVGDHAVRPVKSQHREVCHRLNEGVQQIGETAPWPCAETAGDGFMWSSYHFAPSGSTRTGEAQQPDNRGDRHRGFPFSPVSRNVVGRIEDSRNVAIAGCV